jgi:hypothetical protein
MPFHLPDKISGQDFVGCNADEILHWSREGKPNEEWISYCYLQMIPLKDPDINRLLISSTRDEKVASHIGCSAND